MWTCPICETANDTCKCSKCGFDKSKDYMQSRALSELSEKDRKLPKKQNLRKNEILAYEYKKDFASAKEKMASYIEDYPEDETALREYQFLQTR